MESRMKAKYAMAGVLVALAGAGCKDSDEERSAQGGQTSDPRSVKVDAQHAIAAAILGR